MKIVSCKNCGAKYQLEDSDDISTFECTTCAGDLEVIETYPSDSDSSQLNSTNYEDSYVTQCSECGLKYRINSKDNILDYECASCGGPLKYLDEDMNKELDAYLKEQAKNQEEESQNFIPHKIKKEEKNNEESETKLEQITSIPDRLENFFSEENLQRIVDEETENKSELKHTARTHISPDVFDKFGRRYSVPESNDYNVLKDYLKVEFYKHMGEYYPEIVDETNSPEALKRLEKQLQSEEDKLKEIQESDLDISLDKSQQKMIIKIIGVILVILGAVEAIFQNFTFAAFGMIVGIIIVLYGYYEPRSKPNRHSKESNRSKNRNTVLREHLLTLPDEYYVFYNVQVPTSTSGINHLIVGPSGIYGIVSKKYDSTNTPQSSDDLPLSTDTGGFKYTTKQKTFPKDNAIKQKALTLGEKLIDFLNKNNITNCFVEPLVGFVNDNVVVINTPLTDEDLFIDELLNKIQTASVKLDSETIDRCAVLLSRYATDCSYEL